MDVIEIKKGEYLGRDRDTSKPKFEFIEDEDEWEAAPVVGYMAYFEYLNGFRKTMYWSKEKMMKHADTYSPAFSADAFKQIERGEIPANEMWKYSSFWYKSFDDMAKKTMLRQLISKWGIMSSELQTAFETDASIADVIDNKVEIVADESSVEPPMIYDTSEPEPPAVEPEPPTKEAPKAAARRTKSEPKQLGLNDI